MKIIIAGRTRTGKTTLAKYLAENMGLNVLKSSTDRPRRYPEEDTYHFYTKKESAAIPKSEKLARTTALDAHERWVAEKDLYDTDIAILDENGIAPITTFWHGLGHRVIFIYAEAMNKNRADSAIWSAREHGMSESKAEDEFYERDRTESDAFVRLYQWSKRQLSAQELYGPNHKQKLTEPDWYIHWDNRFKPGSLSWMLRHLQKTLEQETWLSQVGGCMTYAEDEPIILEPEDWTEEEWNALCRMNGFIPHLTERIIFRKPMTKVRIIAPGDPPVETFKEPDDIIHVPEATTELIDLFGTILRRHNALDPDTALLSGDIHDVLAPETEQWLKNLLLRKTTGTRIVTTDSIENKD